MAKAANPLRERFVRLGIALLLYGVARLTVIQGTERRVVELPAFASIGRHPDNTIQLLDRIVSKEHAHLRQLPDGRYELRDLGSMNGTFFRGGRVTTRILEDGDEIVMGSVRLIFIGDVSPKPQVTIAPSSAQSFIRNKVELGEGFLPEAQISNEAQLRRDYERLRTGHELARAVGTELDLDRLLSKILDRTFELVRADRGAFLLRDDRGDLVPRYVKSRIGNRDPDIRLSQTVLSDVMNTKSALLSSDASVDSRFSAAQSIILQGIRSTMTLPLVYGDEIMGILHLDTQNASNLFTEKDLQICAGLAAQAAVSIQNARLASRIEKDAQTRAQIERLIPPAVVEQVVSGELVIEKGGRQSEITMLFSDIRGFTTMSDGQPPEEVVSTLNEYFEVMVDILFKFKGTLDKFVGDEIIGLFGAPIPVADSPFQAVACALAMMHGLAELNATRVRRGLPQLDIGIGINTGQVITGAIGSTRALQYTAIGDAMNTASRLVDLASAGEVIISDATYRQVAERVEAELLPPVRVKGKAEELCVYRVRGLHGMPDWHAQTNA